MSLVNALQRLFICKSLILSIFLLLPSHANSQILSPEKLNQALKTIHAQFQLEKSGKNADYIPELAKVNPNLFAIAVMTVDGKLYSIGDADIPFAIESISKLFVYALAMQDNGEKLIADKVGLNATGHRFNSVMAIEERPDHLGNPLVNAGAIQVTSYIRGQDPAEKWQRVLHFFERLSDGKVYLGQAVYESEAATNQHNQAIAELLDSYGMMPTDSRDAVDRYTKACSLMVTAKQLVLMGAVLANGGVHPISKERLIPPMIVRDVLSQMVTNGMYEQSGTWWWRVGLPAKSGVGGAILAVFPGKMAIVAFSPPLDETGNSVRAQAAILELSREWKLHLLGNN